MKLAVDEKSGRITVLPVYVDIIFLAKG